MKITDITHPIYFLSNPQGAIVTPRAHGLDVSKYDLGFNPQNATVQLDFVAQRTSYRLKKDEAFDTLLPGVLQVPIRIAYHYFNFGYSGDGTWKDQVNVMLSVMKDIPYHATAWDYEESYNVMSVQSAVNSYYAIKELEQRTGKPSMLYTSLGLYNKWIYPTIASHGLNWNSVMLWLAQWLYVPNPNGIPTTPNGRTGMTKPWNIWQYTDKGRNMGTVRDYLTDLDVFNGSVDEMKIKLGITDTNPPPSGDTMYKKATGNISIRTGPSTSYPNAKLNDVPQYVLVGDVLEIGQVQNGFVEILKMYRNDVLIQIPPVSWCGNAYLQDTAYIPPVTPPPTTNPISYLIAYDKDGNQLDRYNKA
jgi:GH25 family lysozyme M1 (1,4-beta-N-acetylmuramidase)